MIILNYKLKSNVSLSIESLLAIEKSPSLCKIRLSALSSSNTNAILELYRKYEFKENMSQKEMLDRMINYNNFVIKTNVMYLSEDDRNVFLNYKNCIKKYIIFSYINRKSTIYFLERLFKFKDNEFDFSLVEVVKV